MTKRWLQAQVRLNFNQAYFIGGGGATGGLVDKFLLVDGRGWPYIPGSTVKGRLRHNFTLLARAAGEEICRSGMGDTACTCLVCQVFGSSGHNPGSFYFDHLYLTEEALTTVTEEGVSHFIQPRIGVGIDRRRRTAANELLFTTEIMWTLGGLPFSGTIEGPLVGDRAEQIAALLYLAWQLIFSLGGSQSRGLGWARGHMELQLDGRPVQTTELERWARTWTFS